MENNKKFCPYCSKETQYTIVEKEAIRAFCEKNVKFIEKQAICNECGNEVFVPEISDENLDNFYKELFGDKYPEFVKIIDKINEGHKDNVLIDITGIAKELGVL